MTCFLFFLTVLCLFQACFLSSCLPLSLSLSWFPSFCLSFLLYLFCGCCGGVCFVGFFSFSKCQFFCGYQHKLQTQSSFVTISCLDCVFHLINACLVFVRFFYVLLCTAQHNSLCCFPSPHLLTGDWLGAGESLKDMRGPSPCILPWPSAGLTSGGGQLALAGWLKAMGPGALTAASLEWGQASVSCPLTGFSRVIDRWLPRAMHTVCSVLFCSVLIVYMPLYLLLLLLCVSLCVICELKEFILCGCSHVLPEVMSGDVWLSEKVLCSSQHVTTRTVLRHGGGGLLCVSWPPFFSK